VSETGSLIAALVRVLYAGCVFVGHLVLAAILLAGIWLIEREFLLLWPQEEPKFFGWCPVKWLFDAGEFGIVATVMVFGIIEVIKQLRTRAVE
jgi:hypothetical protein